MKKIDLDRNLLKKDFDRKVVRRLNDIADRYKDLGKVKGNPLIYMVYIMDFGCFESGLTVIEPGKVNGEFYMTKGHRHKKPTKEIYILLGGRGKLLIQSKSAKVFDMKKDKIYILPKRAGHRLINTGKKQMEVLTIYSKDAGHDYNFKFTKRFFGK